MLKLHGSTKAGRSVSSPFFLFDFFLHSTFFSAFNMFFFVHKTSRQAVFSICIHTYLSCYLLSYLCHYYSFTHCSFLFYSLFFTFVFSFFPHFCSYYMLNGKLVCEQDWHKMVKAPVANNSTPPVRKGKVGRPRRSRD